MAKQHPSVTDKYRPKRGKTNWTKIAMLVFVGLAIIGFILQSIPRGQSGPAEPAFVDMGDLTITDAATGEELAALDIEIAATEDRRQMGLMYRKSMAEYNGMLFLMETTEPQSFWMRNTYIPLDIIYVGEDRRIVSIAENTTPQNLDPIPSGAPARYVLEVNGGFCRKKGIEVGDQLDWEESR